jgi:hypothetical protein
MKILRNHGWLGRLLWVLLGAVGVVLLYVLSYFALMDRDVPAVGESGRYAYRSSFWLTPSARVEGPVTTFAPAVSPLNVFFEPIDDYWRGLCGYIDAVPENEPFATGQLNPQRITDITVFLHPPEMSWPEKYAEVSGGTRVAVGEGAAEELCQALSEEPSVLHNEGYGAEVTGTIRAVIDGEEAVFLFFCVCRNLDVYVFYPGSPSEDPRAGGRGQNTLLPWLEKYVFRKPHRQDEQSGPVGAAMKVDNSA